MLLLCITRLPLIFHEEIDDLLDVQVKAGQVPEGTRLVESRPRGSKRPCGRAKGRGERCRAANR